jgi:hypothetical protein
MKRSGFADPDYGAIASLLAMVVIGYFLLPWAWDQGWIAFIASLASLFMGWILLVIVGSMVLWVLDIWASRLAKRSNIGKSNDEAS